MPLDEEDAEFASPAPPPYTAHPQDASATPLQLPSYEQSEGKGRDAAGALGFVNSCFGDDGARDDNRKLRSNTGNSTENPYDTLPEHGAAATSLPASPTEQEYNNPLYAAISETNSGSDNVFNESAHALYTQPGRSMPANGSHGSNSEESHYDVLRSPAAAPAPAAGTSQA